jgi:hypothetical protein
MPWRYSRMLPALATNSRLSVPERRLSGGHFADLYLRSGPVAVCADAQWGRPSLALPRAPLYGAMILVLHVAANKETYGEARKPRRTLFECNTSP